MAFIGNTQQNQSYAPAVDFFSGNGSTTAFTLSRPVASTAAIQVIVSNVAQNPSSAYTVSGNTITFTSAPPSGTNNIYVYYTSPNNTVIQPSDGTVQTSSIATGVIIPEKLSTGAPYWNSSGNVGIGTSSPSTSINVSKTGTNASVLLTRTDASISGSLKLEEGNSASFIVQSGAKPITFYTSNTERMRIDSSGNLLVGTTSAGGIGLSIYADVSGRYSVYNTSYSGFSANVFKYNGTQVGTILVNSTSTSYNTSSDYRLKENIQPMQNALGVVQQLNPVTYTWKADGSDGQGFIAHELQAVVPDCVTGEKDAVDEEGNPVYQGIDTSFLVATLCKAIQELKAEVDELKAKVQ